MYDLNLCYVSKFEKTTIILYVYIWIFDVLAGFVIYNRVELSIKW